MDAYKYLGQLKKIEAMIDNKIKEQDRMHMIAMKTTPSYCSERVQSSTSQQKMADAVDAIVDAEREIAKSIVELTEKKKEIISVIEQLEDEEYDFLHKMYVQNLTRDDIANINGRSYTWAANRHRVAMKHVDIILQERKQ